MTYLPPEIQMETIACPLCGGQQFSLVAASADPVTNLGGEFQVRECRTCSMTITNPRPTMNSLGIFYPAEYAPYQARPMNAAAKRRLGWTKAFLESAQTSKPALGLRIKAWLAQWFVRHSYQRDTWIPWTGARRMLDIGCGAGRFLEQMQLLGWNVQGLDFSDEVAAEVSQRLGIPVHSGTLPHPGIQHDQFDLVTGWHVLEHVPDPVATLREVSQALCPGGLAVFCVPNFDAATRQRFGTDWYALELPRHLNHFTSTTLAESVKQAGLVVESIDTIAFEGCVRHSAKLAKRRGNLSGINWLLQYKPFAGLISNWDEWCERGEFLKVVARKPQQVSVRIPLAETLTARAA